jgi:hypothetical protein
MYSSQQGFNKCQHFVAMKGFISPGAAKITSARSPIIPALTNAGAFLGGRRHCRPLLGEDCVPKNLRACPFAVITMYLPLQ